MQTITLNVDSTYVWNEVAKITAYVGHKLTEQPEADEKAYDRILMTDDDAEDFQQFWAEAAMVANEQLKEIILQPGMLESDYTVMLSVNDRYNELFNTSVETSLTSYFINAIVGRWFMFALPEQAEYYSLKAVTMLSNTFSLLLGKKRIIRRKQSPF